MTLLSAIIEFFFPPEPFFVRIMTDQQSFGKIREVGLTTPPATCPFNNKPRVSKEVMKIMRNTFLKFVLAINGLFVFRKLMIPQAGWLNTTYQNGKDQPAQALGFAGNVLKILKVVQGPNIGGFPKFYGLVEAMGFEGIVPEGLSFEMYPWLVHYFTTSKRDGWLGKLGKGYDAFIVILKRTELWVDMSRVEQFPILPREVMIVTPSLHVRQYPSKSSNELDGLISGEKVIVTEYACRGRNVWGRINRGWINLQDVTPGRIQTFTSWKMATPPPPM